jgi:SAM-dependent methyltransferase
VPLHSFPEQIAAILCCPDDGAPVQCADNALRCVSCFRQFEVRGANLVEMLPSRPRELSGDCTAYRQGYLEAFRKPFADDPDALAWGSSELVSNSWIRKRLRQVERVEPIVLDGITEQSILCDVAAGAGHYTFAYANKFRLVFHCDLSVTNLNYARRKAAMLGVENMVFVRADYFAPPFRQTVDRTICLDTLIRGEEHDAALLLGIGQTLTACGQGIIDFHNWWHNPLRRLGLLPDNFHHNKSYTRSQTERLLRRVGFEKFSYTPYVQEADSTFSGKLVSAFLPATRLIYRFHAPPLLVGPPVIDQLATRI